MPRLLNAKLRNANTRLTLGGWSRWLFGRILGTPTTILVYAAEIRVL